MSNRTIDLLILFLVAVYVLNYATPHLFIALGKLIHLLVAAILILVLVRLLQSGSVR